MWSRQLIMLCGLQKRPGCSVMKFIETGLEGGYKSIVLNFVTFLILLSGRIPCDFFLLIYFSLDTQSPQPRRNWRRHRWRCMTYPFVFIDLFFLVIIVFCYIGFLIDDKFYWRFLIILQIMRNKKLLVYSIKMVMCNFFQGI